MHATQKAGKIDLPKRATKDAYHNSRGSQTMHKNKPLLLRCVPSKRHDKAELLASPQKLHLTILKAYK